MSSPSWGFGVVSGIGSIIVVGLVVGLVVGFVVCSVGLVVGVVVGLVVITSVVVFVIGVVVGIVVVTSVVVLVLGIVVGVVVGVEALACGVFGAGTLVQNHQLASSLGHVVLDLMPIFLELVCQLVGEVGRDRACG